MTLSDVWPDTSLRTLMATLPQRGTVVWIGVRPARRSAMQAVSVVEAEAGAGLHDDHYHARDGRRQVTLIQAEHLTAVAALLGRPSLAPELLRRNIVVCGINLLALKDRRFRVGDAVLLGTGACHPCSRMEEALGSGGYNAMRGHGGITARIERSGRISIGDAVVVGKATG